MLYVLNSLIIPVNFDKTEEVNLKLRKISIEEARQLIQENPNFISAVGHAATAEILTQLLGVEIPLNRISVYMRKGDMGIHFYLKERLPEGVVLSREELEKLPYWLVLSEVV